MRTVLWLTSICVVRSQVIQTELKSLVFENLTIDYEELKSCPDLQILVIKGYENLEKNIFQGLFKLKILNVTKSFSNPIKLDGHNFADLKSLESLNLKQNKISKISIEEFANLISLKELYLDENSLKEIDKKTFVSNFNLEIISLKSNDISKIHYKTFSSLSKLREIDLALNNIKSLQSAIFVKNNNLEMIDFYNNNLQHIEATIFQHLKKLKKAEFEENPCISNLIDSTNILKLNETIYLSCKVNELVELEWAKDELQELKEENDLLTNKLLASRLAYEKLIAIEKYNDQSLILQVLAKENATIETDNRKQLEEKSNETLADELKKCNDEKEELNQSQNTLEEEILSLKIKFGTHSNNFTENQI